MNRFTWPNREIRHRLAILIKNRFPDLVVSTPSVHDQEIKVIAAPVQNDKSESPCLESGSIQVRSSEAINVIRDRLIFRMNRIPFQDGAGRLDRITGRHPFRLRL